MDEEKKLQMLENMSYEIIDAIITNDLEKQFAMFFSYGEVKEDE